MSSAASAPWAAEAPRRRAGLALLAVLLGLSPLLAGALALARGRVQSQAGSDLIARREQALPAKISGGPRLPKGSWLQLQAGKPETWNALVRRAPGREDRVLKAVKRLRGGQAAWVLRGEGPAADFRWPELAVARPPMKLEATGYDPGPVDNTRGWVGTTKSGERARFGIVAVDPRIIPLGSRVYVEGYGPGLAADIGGAIKGKKIDLCFNSSHQARAWGRRPVRVWVVDPVPAKRREAFLAAVLGDVAGADRAP
jgi:3D (Asp-Asp-Asp) domain-containing protein